MNQRHQSPAAGLDLRRDAARPSASPTAMITPAERSASSSVVPKDLAAPVDLGADRHSVIDETCDSVWPSVSRASRA